MGLLELLQQGKTLLSAGAFPGDAPINDPQSGFIQENSPTNTYNSETIGQYNNGSVLTNTLDNTGLDNNNFIHDVNKPQPSYNQGFPLYTAGKFGQSPYPYVEYYNPIGNGPHFYMWQQHVNFLKDIETNPQVNTLNKTSLDNTDTNTISTLPLPGTVGGLYPSLAKGKWRGVASNFTQPWEPNAVYLETIPIKSVNSPQKSTLSDTSLDNTTPGFIATTDPIPNSTSYPNNYPTVSPQTGMGMFGFGPSNYYSNYNWLNGYSSQNNYDNIIATSNNLLVTYTPQSGLSINNNGTAAFSLLNSNQFNQTYLGNVGFPDNVTGDFGNNPNTFQQYYSPSNTYLGNIEAYSGTNNYHVANELLRTSLDNTNSQNESNIVPDSLAYPNQYPALVSGELGGAPSQYESSYNVNNTYLNNISIEDPNSPQTNTLGQTSLDNIDSTTISNVAIPNNISAPNIYPVLTSGEFNGAASQYVTPYSSDNPYLNSVSIQDPTSPQYTSLGETGLDLEDATYAPTAIVPNSTSYPNNYPALSGVNLAGIGAPKQYSTNWRQNNNYLNNFGSSLHSSLFGISNLDNASSTTSSPLIDNQIDINNNFNIIFASSLTGDTSVASNTPPPLTSISPTNYPALQHVYLGEFNGAPSQYNTVYNARSTYLQNYNTITNPTTNPQTNTLDETGLDAGDSEALLTSLLFAPTNPDNITSYPAIAGINLGVTGSGAQGFNQIYKPSNTYWGNYQNNRSVFDAISA